MTEATAEVPVEAPVTPEATATPTPEAAKEVPKETPTDDGDSLLGKKPEVKVAEKQIPEKYEFKAPEGMELDTAFLEQAQPLLKELKLDQNEAGKLFELVVKKEQANIDRWNKTVEGWKQQTTKELGENPEAELAYTSKFIDKFGGKRADGIRQILNDSGLGSHPDIVFLFREAGKFHSSDSLATGSNNNKPTDAESRAKRMFPNTKY